MAKVVGLGGIFFKSEDPKKLCDWYEKWLNLTIERDTMSASFKRNNMPEFSLGVWCPFKKDTKYFDPAQKEFMFNLMVDDLDVMLKQVAAGGAEIINGVEEYEFGKFGWFIDPEGNKVELWQPMQAG